MNIASLELCKELYELSGWVLTEKMWCYGGRSEGKFSNGWVLIASDEDSINQGHGILAYDLGYLLRKLPAKEWHINYYPHQSYRAILFDSEGGTEYVLVADISEDAACKLCIELFKQGILTKESH
jgi:hypothetical protein